MCDLVERQCEHNEGDYLQLLIHHRCQYRFLHVDVCVKLGPFCTCHNYCNFKQCTRIGSDWIHFFIFSLLTVHLIIGLSSTVLQKNCTVVLACGPAFHSDITI